jgi:sarcosine oxidase
MSVRIVIVGGGVIGLLTAIACVSAGHEVTVVDQASLPFEGAASCDQHRVLRALHTGDPLATAVAIMAHHRWTGLEQLLSASFYEQVGALTVLPVEDLPAARDLLTQAGSRPCTLYPAALAAAYPRVRFPAGRGGIFETPAGVLLADRVLAADVGWLRRQPRADLRPHCRAIAVDPGVPAIELADGEVVRADAIVLAMGPWSRALLPSSLASGLVLRRQSMIYCRVPATFAAGWSAVPSIRSLGADGGTWLVPPVAGTFLKISAASACRTAAVVDGHQTPPYWRQHLIDAAAAVIPGFGQGWLTGTRDCYYLERTPAGGPMLASLADRIFACAACGGGSFKFAPLIAQSLAERLTGAQPVPTGLPWIDGGIMRVPPASTVPHRQTRPVMRGVS